MSLPLQLPHSDIGRTAVVRCEQHECIIGDAGSIKRIKNAANHRVRLHDQIGVVAVELTSALPLGIHGQRRVGRCQWQVEQEWTRLFGVGANKGGSTISKRRKNWFQFPVGERWSLNAGLILPFSMKQ